MILRVRNRVFQKTRFLCIQGKKEMNRKKHEPMIAVCGLDCVNECGLLYKRCDGCRGDRAKHWSASCWILKCCVDDKGLEFCNKCEDFPCQKLEEWAGKSSRYTVALNRLKDMQTLLNA